MMTINLAGGHRAIIDDADFPLVAAYQWRVFRNRNGALYARAHGPQSPDGKRPTIYMARLVAGAVPGQHVDHVNGDTLDNRRNNLRLTDQRGNAINRRRRGNAGLPKGVSRPARGGFRVRLGKNGAAFDARFSTLEAAQQAAREQAIALYGEFAYEARP